MLEAATGSRVVVRDGGGVHGQAERLGPLDPVVHVQLDSAGGLTEPQVRALLEAELPVGAGLELDVRFPGDGAATVRHDERWRAEHCPDCGRAVPPGVEVCACGYPLMFLRQDKPGGRPQAESAPGGGDDTDELPVVERRSCAASTSPPWSRAADGRARLRGLRRGEPVEPDLVRAVRRRPAGAQRAGATRARTGSTCPRARPGPRERGPGPAVGRPASVRGR